MGLISSLVQQNIINSNRNITNSLEKLSTGLRINKASDNASGLAISDKLRTQASGIKQGIENANSAVAMMNIADKAIDELSNILDIIKAKSIQMNTDTTSEEGRVIIKNDILKLIDSYDSIVCSTNYNQIPLLTGCESPFDFQVAPQSSDIISVDINNIEARQMGMPDPFKLKNFISGFAPFPSPPIFVPAPPNLDDNGLVGQTGVVRINFSWFENIDIDPVVIDPSGDAMGYAASWPEGDINGNSRTTNSGGLWDVDDMGNGSGLVDNPNQENFFWETTAPKGDYKFYIRNYSNSWPDNKPINVKVIIKTGDNIETRNLSIPVGQQNIGPFTFNYDGGGELGSEIIPPNNSNNNQGCACDSTQLVRNDTNPNLKVQAQILMDIVDTSLTQLNYQRANVGAGTNQIESSIRNNMTGYTQLKTAESVIRDVDYAQESANFSKYNIISQAGSFSITQANQVEKNWVDQLLK